MKDYGKNAKKILFAFGILSFLMVIVSLVYMNQYTNLWFYETVNGITANDSSVASSNSNSSFFGFLNNTTSQNLANFNSYFSFSGDSSYVGSLAAGLSMDVYRGLNNVNTMILWLGLVSLVVFALIMLFGNGSRKIYYKSNLVAGILLPLISCVFGIIVLVQNTMEIGVIAEHSDLLRAIDSIIESSGYTTASIDELIAASNINSLTIILVDVFLVIFVCYSLFTAIYSYRRYTSCKEERESIIKKAVDANE